MGVLESIKPFWPLLFTFILPRALSYARALQVAIRTRPSPRPLPPKTSNALNILFLTTCIFLFSSLPTRRGINHDNIFITTNSRLHIPTDVLFTRLALSRPSQLLTTSDEDLRLKLTTPSLRQIYLRFGPSTLLTCPFCQPDDPTSYLLYHLPSNILLPHLLHIFALGLSTSLTVSGPSASTWRFPVLVSAVALLAVDLYLTLTFQPPIDAIMPAPQGVYWTASLLRPLVLCIFDIALAGVIYASATNRLLMSSSQTPDAETNRRKTLEVLSSTNLSLQTTAMKLRAVNVARNAVVRDVRLKGVEDGYWAEVVAVEGMGMGGLEGDEVWGDEEVKRAMNRAYGGGGVDVGRMRREAGEWVQGVTGGLT